MGDRVHLRATLLLVTLALLTLALLTLALLTLGLVRPWGEVLPKRIPFIGASAFRR